MNTRQVCPIQQTNRVKPTNAADGEPASLPLSIHTKAAERHLKQEACLVTPASHPHLNPQSWSPLYRWFLTGLSGLFLLNATFASSAPSQLLPSITTHFKVSKEVGILTIALFVAGYCVGPLLWGPLSELYGRKRVFICAFFPYTALQVGCALSPNIGALLVFRFLSGCFAASPLTIAGGIIADIWQAKQRGIALAIFALAPFAGPALAPIVAGALEDGSVSWRWIFWILTIFAGVCLAMIVVLLPETHMPTLLSREAHALRKNTDLCYYATSDRQSSRPSIRQMLERTVLKPCIMLVQEPMLFVMSLYISFIYGIMYLLLEVIPIIFQHYHHWNALQGGLAFLGLPIGGMIGVLVYMFYYNPRFAKKHQANSGKALAPEERLEPLMLASALFAASFFWVGWTYYPSINPASPLIAIGVMGYAILLLFLGVYNYLIDTYLMNAASALAISTVMRSTFGAGFPLFAGQMFNKLGVPGAASLLGGLAMLFIPVPFILSRYGPRIRKMSKNTIVIN